MVRLLLIDDNPDDRELAKRELRREFSDLEVEELIEASALAQVLEPGKFDLAITDYQLGWSNGIEVLRAIKARCPECPVIMFTNSGSEEVAVEAMKSGLEDYIIKSPKRYNRLATAAKSVLQRVEATRRAARLQIRLQTLLERLNVGVFRSTLDRRLLEANAAFLRLLKLSSLAQAQSMDLQQLYLPPQEYSRFADREVQLRRVDGSEIWVSISETLTTANGETFIDGTIEDISDRKQIEVERAQMLEREQAARIEAEAANRLKDEFLATLSHELRTPLSAIVGWSKMLGAGRLDGKTSAHAIRSIENNSQSLAQMIEDLLDVSGIIAGKLRFELRPVDLIPVIEAALYTVRPSVEAKNIQLEFVFDSSASLVSGDPDRLQQVVWNLLSNAIKFTPSGGRVEVRLERIDSNVEISVSDTGVGIDPEFLPYVFDRFRQADSSSTRMHGGLGLGLAIARHLVELQGGRLFAESSGKGKGATFRLQLPLLNPTQNTRSQEDTDLLLTDLHVLIVICQLDLRELLIVVLEEYKAKVTAVTSVAEAMAVFEKLKPDVIVSELELFGEDGYSLIAKVRNLEAKQGKKTPALALTALPSEEEQRRTLAAGFQAYLAQPFAPEDLVVAIARIAW